MPVNADQPRPDAAAEPTATLSASVLQIILDRSSEPHGIADAETRLIWVNDAFRNMLGYAREELLELSVPDVDVTFNPDRFRAHLRERATMEWRAFETVYRRKDGSTFPVELHITVAVLPEGTFLLASPRDISARKALEAKREEDLSAERAARAGIESILGSISDGFFATDLDWRITYVNDEGVRLLGMERELLLGGNLWELFPLAAGSDFDTHYHRAMETGERTSFETYYPPYDLWVSVRAYPGPDGLAVYLQDITSKKRAEQALAESEARLRAVQDESPDGFMLFRSVREATTDGSPGKIVDFEWIYVNPAACRVVGRRAEELVGSRLIQLMPGNKEDGLFDMYIEVVETGKPNGREFHYHHEGLDHGFRNIAVKVGDGFAVTFSDITARIQAEAAMRRSEERYAIAARATGHAIYDFDIATGVMTWSEGISSVFGYDVAGQPLPLQWLLDIIHPDDVERVNTSAQRAAANDEDMWQEAFRLTRADGSRAHVVARASGIRGSDGRLARNIGSIEDVSERVDLEERLRQAQKMEAVGQLAGGIAHDFNNLLTIITGNLELVQLELPRAHPSRPDLDEIAGAAERARTLVRHLLTFSRKNVVHPRLLQVGEVVKGAEKLLRRVIGEEIVLDVSAWDDEVRARLDPGQVEQVVFNLVVNARDALLTPLHGKRGTGGSIIVEVAPVELTAGERGAWEDLAPGHYVQLTVRDTGHGMDEEVRARIFEPFFTTKPVGAGTGLGLATVFGIVRAANGAIDVESAPGRGTTFRIRFPVAREEAEAPPLPPLPTFSAPSAATVLVVEDEAPLRALMRRILQRAGYGVLEARHGRDALHLWNAHRASIVAVMTDLRMPEMGGRELVRLLYRDRPALPVLFLSGYSELSDETTLADNERFVEKPFTSEQILQTLARMLQKMPATGGEVLEE